MLQTDVVKYGDNLSGGGTKEALASMIELHSKITQLDD